MGKNYMVIGLGRLGTSIVKELSLHTKDIIGVDVDEACVNQVSEYIEQCFVCDSTKKRILEEIGAKNIDHAVVAIGNNLQATILTTINLKELGVKYITVRVDDSEYSNVLERLGADDVLIPEDDAGRQYAKQILSDTMLDYYSIDQEHAIVQIAIPHDFEEHSLLELDYRNKYDINIVGIIRSGKFFLPKGSDTIKPLDAILVVGRNLKITKFDKAING